MITEIRKTISGTEYWDSKEKRSIFVPTGKTLAIDPVKEIMNLDLDKLPLGINRLKDSDAIEIKLDDMNAEELHSFAKDNGIDVPAKLKKEETIRNHIVEQLTTDAK